MTLIESKRNFLANKNEKTYRDFCVALQQSPIFLPMEWNLTDAEEKQFEEANIGDTVHIESKMLPVALVLKKHLLIPVFSDESEISDRVRKNYTIMQCNSKVVLAAYKAYKKVTGKDVRIVLDIDTEPLDFDDEELTYRI